MTEDRDRTKPSAPAKLTKADDRTAFESGAAELDDWLEKYSWQNQRANNATTYVSTVDGRVVGYYAITVAGYERSAAPEEIAKKAPQPIPCFLLARLAIDLEWQGRGLGWGLSRDALHRVLTLSQSVAAPACWSMRAMTPPARSTSTTRSSFSHRSTRCIFSYP